MALDASTVLVVVARADSKRLPGKPLLRLGTGTVLEHVVARLRPLDRPIVLATTNRPLDDQLAGHAEELQLSVYRGATHDVASRVTAAAEIEGADWFVRANADSPFPAPDLLNEAGSLQRPNVELVSNLPNRTFPYGVSVEIVRVSSLRRRLDELTPAQREHVTAIFYGGDVARIEHMRSDRPDLRNARLTIDTEDDLKAMRRVVDSLEDSTTASWIEIAALALRFDRKRGSC